MGRKARTFGGEVEEIPGTPNEQNNVSMFIA